MYSLREGWKLMHGDNTVNHWDGMMLCNETDATLTFRANNIQGFLAAYTFTLVIEGWLTIVYNGQELTLQADDLYIYSPGLPVTIISTSENYHGICLLADERATIEMPSVRDLVRIAYQPIVQLHQPVVKLQHETALKMASKMREIITYLNSDHIYKSEIIRMLYAVFLLDLQNAQEQAIDNHPVPQRVEELFIDFIRLLPDHFAQHHDIGFYASRLNISKVYLSRIVRQVTGRRSRVHRSNAAYGGVVPVAHITTQHKPDCRPSALRRHSFFQQVLLTNEGNVAQRIQGTYLRTPASLSSSSIVRLMSRYFLP